MCNQREIRTFADSVCSTRHATPSSFAIAGNFCWSTNVFCSAAAGRVDATLISLVPAYGNVQIRLVERETQHSDTCSFHRTLLEQVRGQFEKPLRVVMCSLRTICCCTS